MKRFKKILLETLILLYLAVVLTLVGIERSGLICTDLSVSVIDGTGGLFVEGADIKSIINKKEGQGAGSRLAGIKIGMLEAEIAKHPFVEKAEVYRTVKGSLQIDIWQRRPIIRVVNYNGESYYIDSNAAMMPLSDKYAARVPVATGSLDVPFSRRRLPVTGANDELGRTTVLADLYKLASYIDSHELYSPMIEQIHVYASHEFDLVPKVGPKIINFGKAERIEDKFFMLSAFYRHAPKFRNWAEYKSVNVKFKNQIVCTK
jgi:cell division protein FtsQ